MEKINQNKKNLIAISGFAVAIVAILFFLTYPYFQKISDLNTSIYDQRVQLAILEQQRINTEQTHADYNKIKNDFDDINKIFVNPDDMLNFISKLESITNQHSLTQQISLSTTATAFTNNTLPITLTTEGTWANTINYLIDLQRLDTYVSINSLSIAKSGETVTTMISAKIFSQSK